MKSNGTVNVAVKNLNNLSGALRSFTDASNATRSVGKLVGSLTKLKEIGTVSSVGNSLTKLSASLKSLDKVKIDNVAPQIQRIADAVAPLSAVRGGGFSSMVNAMAKIEKVTKGLDDTKINAFAERIQKLNDVLDPLSKKMTTIQQGLRSMNASARSAGSGVKQMGEDAGGASINMASLIYIVQEVVQWIDAAIQKFSQFVSAAIEWDGIAARFGRGFGDNAQEVYDWIVTLNEEMGINIQQFMQYSSIYANMLTGFGVAAEDAREMALGYTELTYDIWAGYNDVYKTFEEASEAVKSAIAGEVEPVRRAGFTIIESTLQMTAAKHGLSVSIETATEAEKSYLRYLTLVDQAYAQSLVGTYAKELNTAEGLMRTFSQQLKSLSQAFGSLFLPALTAIMPYLQAFVELLTEAVHWIAGLFGIEIQAVDWSGYEAGAGAISDVTDSANDATGALDSAAQAAKDLKNATLGIDELNVISSPSATGGSGGSGGGAGGIGGGGGFGDLDIDSLWDDSIFKDINDQVDAIKEKFKAWLPVIGLIGSALAGLAVLTLLENLGSALEAMNEMDTKIGALKKALAGIAILTIQAVLVFTLADEYLESGNLMALVGEALATAAGGYLMYRGFGTKGLIMALGVSMLAQLAAITLNLADGGVEMDDPQLWIQAAFTAALGAFAGGWLSYKGLVKLTTGQGVGFGLAAGLALTLAAITIGNVAADGDSLVSMITGTVSSLLGGVAGIGILSALGVATGGTAFLIGFAAMLAVNVIGALVASINDDAKKNLEKDMSERFGSIELKDETLDVYIEKVTAIPREVTIDTNVWNEALAAYESKTLTVSVSAALEIFSAESDILSSMEETLESVQSKIDSQNIKIALGIDVEQSDYTESIETFVSSAQGYLDQYYLTTNIAIEILNSDSGDALSGTLSDFYSTNSVRLATLGSDLKKAVSEAFVDGEWIPEKLQEAIDLQKEIQEILDYTSEVEYRATMQNLKLTISGDSLTVESFKDVLSGAKEAIEGRLTELEEVKMSNLKVAILEYDANIEAGMSEAEAKKIYDQTVKDIQEAYEKGVVEVSYGTVDFGLSTLKDAFAKELAEAEKNGWFSYEEKLELTLNDVTLVVDEIDMGEGPVYTGIQSMITNLSNQYAMEASKLSDEARKNLEGLLKAMAPTMEDYENLAETSRKTGTTVIDGVRDGINDYNELKALTGDVQSINYLIGQQFSSDPVFLNTLATVKDSGKHIDKSVAEGLLNNIDYVTASGTDVIVGVKNSVTGEVINITPELKENLSSLGVDMGNALGDEYDYIYNEAGTAIEGVKSSVDDSLTWINPALKSALEDAGIKVGDAFSGKYDYIYDETGTTVTGIKSAVDDTLLWVNPEVKKAAEKTGEELSNGLKEGLDDEEPSLWERLSNWVGDIIDKVEEFFGIASPSKEFEKIGGYLSDGLAEGLGDKEPSLWDTLSEWVTGVIDKVKEFFGKGDTSAEFKVSPKDDSATWWTDVKAWWSGKVGAAKEFTTKAKDDSATWWTNVKSWWSGKVGAAKEFTTTAKDDSATWWTNVKSWWSGKVGPVATFETDVTDEATDWWANAKTYWSKKVGKAQNFKTGVSNSSKTWWSDVKEFWSEKVGKVQNFKTGVSNSSKTWWSDVKEFWSEKVGKVQNFKTGVSNSSKTWWSNTKKWWKEKVGSVASFSVGVKNSAKDWWANVKKWWGEKAGSLKAKLDISLPTINITWGKVTAFGKEFSYPKSFKLDFAAAGGIFDAGSLIWAGEHGAEIVANAGGGKTGVMNVDQMADAVFEGVYAAVMAANRASQGEGGNQSINVYLDGKQITATVEKRQRERGASIMGNQVYGYG